MKKILENPKVTIYENVAIITDMLEQYMDYCEAEEVAKEILIALGIPKGKKMVVSLYQNNVQAVLENGRMSLKVIS